VLFYNAQGDFWARCALIEAVSEEAQSPKLKAQSFENR
jgi:hypothetical protein